MPKTVLKIHIFQVAENVSACIYMWFGTTNPIHTL